MNKEKIKLEKKLRRKNRVRAKITGTSNCPRLSVRRTNKDIILQLIDDSKGVTLVSASSKDLKGKVDNDFSGKVAVSFELGKLIAKKALDKKIEKIVFDRGGDKYHGRVKAVAEGAREIGLKF